MATTTKQPTPIGDEPMRGDDIRNPPSADWRRMTEVAHDHIARRAYQLYEERGRQPGHDMDDWLRAEHDIEERRSTE